MKKIISCFIVALGILAGCEASKEIPGQALVNHIGYTKSGVKRFVFQTASQSKPKSFAVMDQAGSVVFEGLFENQTGKVANWNTGNAYAGNFSDLKVEGQFSIRVFIEGAEIDSEPFEIADHQVAEKCLPLLVDAFHSQRCKGEYNEKDKKMSFFGDRDDIVDVSGGWYDASGEKGKYLTHLAFSNFMVPQQTPQMIWNMLEASDVVKNGVLKNTGNVLEVLAAEAAYGADYLVRVQDPEGYFYATVFANWSKDPESREICAYVGIEGHRNENYQCAFREGGGLSIAALARISKLGYEGEFSSEKYLATAIKGFDHLVQNNHKYVDDGKENIIDDYCALLAATELFYATGENAYLSYAQQRAENLKNRLISDTNQANWFKADEAGNRPFFHAAEAGLPVIALCRYLEVETDAAKKAAIVEVIQKSVQFELDITNEVNNPYGYARQYVKAVDATAPKAAFFIPHKNETGYWWQGENARLGSLATSVQKALPYLTDQQKVKALTYANNQINWVLGLNPYDACMLEGAGRNNPDYAEGGIRYNYRGGVCNGVTSGVEDDTDIAFKPLPYNDDPSYTWRWGEQWVQHGGWLIPALAYTTVN